MEVSPDALEDFKKIYRKEFKEEISDDEALEMAQRVLMSFSLITRPLPEEKKTRENKSTDSTQEKS